MKKTVSLLLCAIVIFHLVGCESRQHRHNRIMTSAKEYVAQNSDLIREAANWLISHYNDPEQWPEYGYTIHIERSTENEITAQNYTTGQNEIIKNTACETLLLNDGIFKHRYITLHIAEDCQTVEFNVKGIGNNAYYYVVFVPSGNIEDVWDYNSRFTYTEVDGGFLGEQSDGDNSFFYLPLSDDLFYCEAFF